MTLACSPRAISRRFCPLAIREVTSDSANTVHMLEILRSFSASRASRPNSSIVKSQCSGHDLQEFSGAGGAAVVHFEFFHPAVFKQGDGLAVLPADIQHGSGIREKSPRPPGMGFDFGDRRGVKGDLEQVAAIAGGHDAIIGDSVDQLFGFGHGIKAGVGLQAD